MAVGDTIQITVTDAGTVVGRATYTATAADIPADNAPAKVTLDIVIGAGVDVASSEMELPADGTSTSTLTITVMESGAGVTGDTVTVTADQGTVGAVTEVGNGDYTATYTAPRLILTADVDAQITASSAATGESGNVAITLTPVPTTVMFSVTPSTFMADTPSDGAVTVTVDRAGPVADEVVALSLSPAVGSVSAVTNNGDGTYSATYTSGGTAGNVTLTATATGGTCDGHRNRND